MNNNVTVSWKIKIVKKSFTEKIVAAADLTENFGGRRGNEQS